MTLTDVSTAEMQNLRARALGWLRENTPEAMHVEPSGQAVMFSYIGRRNFEAMTQGTLVAFLLISACLMLALRSLRLGLISLIPNIAPPVVAFGMFSLIQTEVGFWTSFVTATAIGLIVDATVHMLTKYRHARINLKRSAEDLGALQLCHCRHGAMGVIRHSGDGLYGAHQFAVPHQRHAGSCGVDDNSGGVDLDFLLLPPLLIEIDGRLRGDAPSAPTPTPTEAS